MPPRISWPHEELHRLGRLGEVSGISAYAISRGFHQVAYPRFACSTPGHGPRGPSWGALVGVGGIASRPYPGKAFATRKTQIPGLRCRACPPRCFGPKPWGDLVVWPPTDRSRTARAASETNGHSRAQRHRTTVRPFGTLTLISRSKSAPKASRGHFGDLLGPCWRLLGPR